MFGKICLHKDMAYSFIFILFIHMKKFMTYLAALMLTTQTLLPGVMYAAPVVTGNATIDAAIEQLLENANFEDLLSVIKDQVGNEVFDAISQIPGGDAVAQYGNAIIFALQSVAENIVADILDTDFEAEVEPVLRDIAEKFVKGEISEEEAKAKMAEVINQAVLDVKGEIKDAVYEAVKEETLNQLSTQSLSEILALAAGFLGDSEIASLIDLIGEATEDQSLLAKLNDPAYKQSIIDAITNKGLDCSTIVDAVEKSDCETGKAEIDALLAEIEAGLESDMNAAGTVGANIELVKSALSAIAGLTTALNPALTAEEEEFLDSVLVLNPDGTVNTVDKDSDEYKDELQNRIDAANEALLGKPIEKSLAETLLVAQCKKDGGGTCST